MPAAVAPQPVDVKLRTLILTLPTVVAVTGTRIYCDSDLPAGYDPSPATGMETTTGPAVLMVHRGGNQNATGVLLNMTYLARCYGSSRQEAQALNQVLFQALDGQSRGDIRAIRCSVLGQHTVLPALQWHLFVSTWQLTVVNR